MPNISAINGPGPQKPVTSPSVTDTLNSVKAMFPELDYISTSSKKSSGSGVARLLCWTKTSRQTVGEIAARLAQNPTKSLPDKDVERLKNIAQSTKKGSESAARVLNIKNDMTLMTSMSEKTTPFTPDDIARLHLIQNTLRTHGSTKLIQKYDKAVVAELSKLSQKTTPLTEDDITRLHQIRNTLYTIDTLWADKLIIKYATTLSPTDKTRFDKEFKQSQTTETGLTDKYKVLAPKLRSRQ